MATLRPSTSLVTAGLILWLGTTAGAQQAGPTAEAAPAAQSPPPADDARAQYPAFLSNAYVTLNVGYINYPFSALQLEPGYEAELVRVPHVAVRGMLFGRHFGEYVSVQGSYMRPVKYVQYHGVNGGTGTRFVWMHFGTVTLRSRLPIGGGVSIYGESGLAITNRSGFDIDDTAVVPDAHFTSSLFGAGIEYRANRTWDVVPGGSYIPAKDEHRQPHAVFVSTGVRYNVRPLPPERVEETVNAGFLFPENLIQIAYATNALGYGVNNLLSKKIPIFWGGRVEVERSVFSVQYQRNVFHTKKVFSFDLGTSFAQWKSSKNGDTFRTVSVYPLLRFTVLRSGSADLYVSYSVAGPSHISRDVIDDRDTGGSFTFQDFMGVGLFIGERRRLNAEIGINWSRDSPAEPVRGDHTDRRVRCYRRRGRDQSLEADASCRLEPVRVEHLRRSPLIERRESVEQRIVQPVVRVHHV